MSNMIEKVSVIPNMNIEEQPPWNVDKFYRDKVLTSRTFINSFKFIWLPEDSYAECEPIPAWINKANFKPLIHRVGCNIYRCIESPLGKPIRRIKRKETFMEKKCIMVTGHRPDKLPGKYNLESPPNKALFNLLVNILEKTQPTACITGMALGVDQIFALAVIKHKETNPNCKLIAAIPCPEQPCKWPAPSQKLYKDILAKCDYVKYVSAKYDNLCMKTRNLWMVKNCTSAIAIYDGTPGGTGHAVNALKTAKIPTLIINPNTGEKTVLNKR